MTARSGAHSSPRSGPARAAGAGAGQSRHTFVGALRQEAAATLVIQTALGQSLRGPKTW